MSIEASTAERPEAIFSPGQTTNSSLAASCPTGIRRVRNRAQPGCVELG